MRAPRWPGSSRATTALLACAVVLLAVLTPLVSLRWDPVLDVDGEVTAGARDAVRDSPTTLSFARVLTHFGDPLVVTLASLVVTALLVAARCYRAALYVLAVRALVVVATAAIKDVVARGRPHQVHPVAVAHGYSYPSGHASGSAALWCSLAILLAGRAHRPVIVGLAATVPLVVATTRVLLGVHFLSDVIAGLAVGFGSATAAAVVVLRRSDVALED